MIRITKGLDLPIAGEPDQTIEDGPPVRRVGLVADDYVGMKPTLAVREGDHVKLGELLFVDKKNPDARYTSPGCGTVAAVHRGERRSFVSLIIDLDGDEEIKLRTFADRELSSLTREQVTQQLVESGLWTAFRTRPYSKVPSAASVPHSLFVTAIDTNPLAPDPQILIQEREADFVYGLNVIRRLTEGRLYLCKRVGAILPGEELDFLTAAEFDGPHPAGLPGTHIHFLDPVGSRKTVWHVNYQDVMAIGRLFATGRLPSERVISLAGPSIRKPRLLRTRMGADLAQLTENELADGRHRVISGSVLSGRASREPAGFLGRYHLQVSAIPEGGERVFLGWQRPGLDKFSIKRVFASAFAGKGKRFAFSTSLEGSPRAMVPVGSYEAVMPLDILPTFLLRALIVEDVEQARALGCLELDEEDLALCTFVCPGKYEYAPMLRKSLARIEKEG